MSRVTSPIRESRISRRGVRRSLAFAALAVSLLSCASAFAVLAPEYQRQRELAAITASPEVVASVSPHPIDRIEAVGPDLYRVKAGPCRLQVRIVGEPMEQGMVGPRRFHLAIGPKTCR